MKFISEHKYLLTGILIGAVTVFLISKVTTERKLRELQVSLDSSIQTSVESTNELAMTLGAGRFTKTAEVIVADCTVEERLSFEDRLARLDSGLSQTELATVDKLFSRCAPVQSIRRTLMMMDLVRRAEAVEALIAQRKQIGSYTTYDAYVSDMKTLLQHEQRVTELSFDLVYLQREIIDMLLAGGSATSPEATELKDRGYALRVELSGEAEKAAIVRARIVES